MNIIIRESKTSDNRAVSELVRASFGTGEGREISNLISDLFSDDSAKPRLSLVAMINKTLAGHILFTHASIKGSEKAISAAILAPLAVAPAYQSRGIGSQLVSRGLDMMKQSGTDLVFVLGYPEYYSRHGFSTAGIAGFEAPFPIPEKNSGAWMVQALRPGLIGNIHGKVVCATALNDPKYWRE